MTGGVGASPPPDARHRKRSVIFGEDAEGYDRARPSYPAALVDDLVDAGGRRVLDVGCGTGKAGRLFADRGCDVLGVETDDRMAVVAQRHGLTVEVAPFEEWNPAGRTFDLVISGQAWHWMDPDTAPAKAAGVLEPGGVLGAFWNRPVYEPGVRRLLDEAYAVAAPDLAATSGELGSRTREKLERDAAILEATGSFGSVEILLYPWGRDYSTAQYLDQLQTHSGHRLLPADRLADLLDRVGSAIDGLGGSVAVEFRTALILARAE